MKQRSLAVKLSSAALSVATAPGPVFAMLDPPGVADSHGDTMDAGALTLPPPGEDGQRRAPLYYVHSYSEEVVQEAAPQDRVAIGEALLFEEDGYPYFVPRFYGNTELSEETKQRLEAGEIAAASIGYLTVRATPNGKGPDGQGEDVHEARLIEVSLVDNGAKKGAVRIKMLSKEDTRKLLEVLKNTRTEVAAIRAKADAGAVRQKSFGVEVMPHSPHLYFATEMMRHLAEAVAACQTYLGEEMPEPALAAIAQASTGSLGEVLAKLTTWLSSGAARGETGTPIPESAPGAEPAGDVVTKWFDSILKKVA